MISHLHLPALHTVSVSTRCIYGVTAMQLPRAYLDSLAPLVLRPALPVNETTPHIPTNPSHPLSCHPALPPLPLEALMRHIHPSKTHGCSSHRIIVRRFCPSQRLRAPYSHTTIL